MLNKMEQGRSWVRDVAETSWCFPFTDLSVVLNEQKRKCNTVAILSVLWHFLKHFLPGFSSMHTPGIPSLQQSACSMFRSRRSRQVELVDCCSEFLSLVRPVCALLFGAISLSWLNKTVIGYTSALYCYSDEIFPVTEYMVTYVTER